MQQALPYRQLPVLHVLCMTLHDLAQLGKSVVADAVNAQHTQLRVQSAVAKLRPECIQADYKLRLTRLSTT